MTVHEKRAFGLHIKFDIFIFLLAIIVIIAILVSMI